MTLRIAMAQLDMLVGDVDGNAERVRQAALKATNEQGAHAIVFPELTLTGYPPEDLLLRRELIERVERALGRLCGEVRGIDVILGYPRASGGKLYNAAGVIRDGAIAAEYHKALLPNYSVFDEKRYFEPGAEPCVVDIRGVPVGVTICEDIWFAAPARRAAAAGARLLVNLNASPYHTGKAPEREQLVGTRAREAGVPILYVNLVGGQDELVFDGGSFVADAEGEIVQRCRFFDAEQAIVEIDTAETVRPVPGPVQDHPAELESIRRALVLGIRDYVHKNGFQGAVLGLSGGIDSAVTLALSAEALGGDQIEAVSMPSRYTADMSNEDAARQAQGLGVAYRVIPIEPAFKAFLEMLSEEFGDLPMDVTEENIQARCRGIVLMAISNKKGKILLTTGNKSEMSVGYATLYGDMAGGFAPIRDLSKTLVYRMAEHLNREREVIPRRVIERPPSAELAPDQQDTDSLPAYEVLDAILFRYVEQDRSVADIVADGFEEATVKRVARLVDRNEYKRRQAPPGIKITRRAFGRDRRYPLTSGF
ncbi:MAG: NAD+ synthase [Chromatiales bacterium]|jgi:NAD+ synthase (glutamine-hydrolysing)